MIRKLIISILFTLLINEVFACTCIPDDTLAHAFNDAAILFIGKVQNIDTVMVHDSIYVMSDSKPKSHWEERTKTMYRVQFLETRTFKGKVNTPNVLILTNQSEMACGFTFIIGSEYMVYGYRERINKVNRKKQSIHPDSNIYTTSACTRTTRFVDSEIKTLRENKLII